MNDPRPSLRLLVVEDEMLILLQTEALLADLGYVTEAAATVRKALVLIAEQKFDAAMLDMNLGGEKSYAVADALAARGVPFLFVTGCTGENMPSGYCDRPLLKKPFRPHHLAEALTALTFSRQTQ